MEKPGGDEPEPTGDDVPESSESSNGETAGGGGSEEYGMYGNDVTDVLPGDLNVSRLHGPHTLPNNNRRRIPGALYLLISSACFVLWVTNDASPLVNDGYAWAALALGLFGIYNLASGWTLRVEESDALVSATREVGFPVGHASAQMGWRGLLSRPTWRILLYSTESPPRKRGLVLIDGVNGDAVEHWVEDNPESWNDTAPPR